MCAVGKKQGVAVCPALRRRERDVAAGDPVPRFLIQRVRTLLILLGYFRSTVYGDGDILRTGFFFFFFSVDMTLSLRWTRGG